MDSFTYKLYFFLRRYLPICEGCAGPCFKPGKLRRLNTAYVDDSLNYSVQCKDCYEHTVAMYADMWSDHYSGLL